MDNIKTGAPIAAAPYPAKERREWLQAIYNIYIQSYKEGHPPSDKYLQDPRDRMLYVIANQLEDLLETMGTPALEPCPGCGNIGRNQHYAGCPRMAD